MKAKGVFSEINIHRDVRTYRNMARNGIFESGLEWEADWFLLLDDDHTFEPSDFTKLWECRKEDSLLGGLYMTRGLPCQPCMFRMTTKGSVPIYYYPSDELLEVDLVGFGFVLLYANLLRKVRPPWFTVGSQHGEDAAFCDRIIRSGGHVFCHTGVKVGHILEQPRIITEEDFLATREQMKYEQVGENELVPIGFQKEGGNGKGGASSGPAGISPGGGRRGFFGGDRAGSSRGRDDECVSADGIAGGRPDSKRWWFGKRGERKRREDEALKGRRLAS
jgi:hypothetical protein